MARSRREWRRLSTPLEGLVTAMVDCCVRLRGYLNRHSTFSTGSIVPTHGDGFTCSHLELDDSKLRFGSSGICLEALELDGIDLDLAPDVQDGRLRDGPMSIGLLEALFAINMDWGATR